MLSKSIYITVLKDIYAKKDVILETTFGEFCETLKVPQVLSMTAEEYESLPQEEQKKNKLGECFRTAVDNKEESSGPTLAYLIALDADHPEPGFKAELETELPGVKTYMHTTFRSREGSPRYRVFMPTSRAVTKEEYEKVCQWINEKVSSELDKQCFNFNQKLQLPRVLKDVAYHTYEWGSNPLDVDRLLAEVNSDAADTGSGSSETETSGGKKEYDSYGPIQAYCEAHPITEIMEELSDVYQKTDKKNRYQLIGADSSPGVIVNPERNIATSFHANDPASSHSCNSFDLYRIHRFGNLDKEVPKGTKKRDLPSFHAMMDKVKGDEKVRKLLEKHREESKPEPISERERIKDKLQQTDKGAYKNSSANAVTIVSEDKDLSGIWYDSFSNRFIVTTPTPWDPADTGYPHFFSDNDRKALIAFISRTYGIEMSTTIDNALAQLTFCRKIHPLQEYFKGLQWDGKKRVEGVLTKYLGCEDSEYTRTVSRVTLVSAVKRIFEPGCKVDTMTVLIGKQGCGKSTFVSRLSKGYFTDNIHFQDMASKIASEKLNGVFIAELSEMAGYSKSEVEMVKSFISCQSDDYREPYARMKSYHPRTSIFIGTSNKFNGFLIDETGNRRFLPVYATDNREVSSWDMTEEEIDQLWAEAYQLYQNGAGTKVPDELLGEVTKMQDGAIMEDVRAQFVQQYLDVLLPEDWYGMSLESRCDYINHEGTYAGRPYSGTLRRDYVCAAEIGTELFKMKKIDLTIGFSKNVALMLRKLGWKEYPTNRGRRKIPGYGLVTTFCRPESDSDPK